MGQEELDQEQKLKDKFTEIFNNHSLKELYIILDTLQKEIRLSEISVAEGYENGI